MKDLKQKKVAELVSENIKTAHIFKKYGIDFCCGGGVSIEKACEKNNVDFDILADELTKVDQLISKREDYKNWDITFLVDHIVQIHHSYVQEAIPMILQYAEKVAKVHGHHYTEVVELYQTFQNLSKELLSHLQKEELILFPFIRAMANARVTGKPIPTPGFGSVDNPIKMMELEHDDAGQALKKISRLTNSFTPPEGACNTFRALYAKLEEFEEDLHRHIHLENNILFPKAKEMFNS